MNKSKLKQFVQGVLTKYSVGDYITDGAELEILLDMFTMHPEYEQKRGGGIKAIYLTATEYYNSKCLAIERADGTTTDISYISCLKGKINKRENIVRACRSAIITEIFTIRDSVRYGVDRCQFTNEILTQNNLHIDHYDLKFADLFAKWIQDKDINWLYLQTNYKSEDMSFITCFLNEQVADDFRQFHNNNTHLRAVSKRANLTLLK